MQVESQLLPTLVVRFVGPGMRTRLQGRVVRCGRKEQSRGWETRTGTEKVHPTVCSKARNYTLEVLHRAARYNTLRTPALRSQIFSQAPPFWCAV